MGLLTSYLEHRWSKKKGSDSTPASGDDNTDSTAPEKHHGGKITKTRTYKLLKGERVLSRAQAKRYKRSGKRSSK